MYSIFGCFPSNASLSHCHSFGQLLPSPCRTDLLRPRIFQQFCIGSLGAAAHRNSPCLGAEDGPATEPDEPW